MSAYDRYRSHKGLEELALLLELDLLLGRRRDFVRRLGKALDVPCPPSPQRSKQGTSSGTQPVKKTVTARLPWATDSFTLRYRNPHTETGASHVR